jgi:sugar lactone lactonase YvrE
MADRDLTPLLDGGSFFEGPRWHDDRWWVSDFYRHQVMAVTPDGRAEAVMTVEGQPSGLGWMPDGSLLVVSMRDRRLLRRSADGRVEIHAELGEHCAGLLNDMVVSVSGHAYVGNFGFDIMNGADPATTNLVRVAPDGAVTVEADGMWFPNGSVITPDGTTLIVAETTGCRLSGFTVEADGSLSGQRVWAELAPLPQPGTLAEVLPQIKVAPDGCTLDAEGQMWCADGLGGRVIRVAEGGTVTDEITGPKDMGVYACMLGGADGRTLMMCTAPDFFEHARRDAREAVLFTTEVEVPRAGLP